MYAEAFVSQEIADCNHVSYCYTYQSSSDTVPGLSNVSSMWSCWNSHILLAGLLKYNPSRNCAPTQMELPHRHRKNVSGRAILKKFLLETSQSVFSVVQWCIQTLILHSKYRRTVYRCTPCCGWIAQTCRVT